ncbi:17486_t:CDS:2 [Funneliformis geosporum]|uniref:19168_t:CDS:1 n=1 Tax=Funneliformis geosporum TaxID=1117311 RepID=A0A9W4SBG4_9GLOM|nr:17486_t:CDS:2 [Funneliformis geosporum]CAI2162961.1 19168_t:CDS:2 [Funneliformis geosporum]
MAAITNKVFKETESWLTKERQKFENFAEEKFQKFSTEYQQEVDWLRNYLQDIVFRKTKVEKKKNEHEISNQLNHEIEPRESLKIPLVTRDFSKIMRNNVEIVDTASITQQLKRIVKHTPKSKPEKPEIKSLVLAAAAAKREKEEQDKRLVRAKEWEKARLRRQEEQQKRLQSLKNRDDELRKKVIVISDTKKKDTDLIRKKKIDNKNSKDTLQNQTGQNQKETDRTVHTNENTSVIISKKVQLYDQLKRLGHIKKQTELPEIDSDEDEKVEIKNRRIRKDWEQSPELKAALINQSSIDPETIFGKILPLNIDEIFGEREHRLRPRSSSANWSGLDALTEEEELEYKIHMGFL